MIQMVLAWSLTDVLDRGGVVMWPLIGLSIVSLTLVFERALFYWSNNGPASTSRATALARLLRAGRHADARDQAQRDSGVYSQAVAQVLSEPLSESAAVDAIEVQRARLDRFLPTLSTIVTAAPMLGILGTVIGIIGAFNELSGKRSELDLNNLGGDIGEALITTAAGITVALLTLLPYNLFRAQAERSLSRLESLMSSALAGGSHPTHRPTGATGQDKQA